MASSSGWSNGHSAAPLDDIQELHVSMDDDGNWEASPVQKDEDWEADCNTDMPSNSACASPSEKVKDPRRRVLAQQMEDLNTLASKFGELLVSLTVDEEESCLELIAPQKLSQKAFSSQPKSTGGDLEPMPETEDPEPETQVTNQVVPSAEEIHRIQNPLHHVQLQAMNSGYNSGYNHQHMPFWQMMAMRQYVARINMAPVGHDSSTETFPMAKVWPQLSYNFTEPPGAQPPSSQNGHHADEKLAAIDEGERKEVEETPTQEASEDVLHYSNSYLMMPNANLFWYMHAQHVAQQREQWIAQHREQMEAQQAKEYREKVGRQAMHQWLWAQKGPAQRNTTNPLGPPTLGEEFGFGAGAGLHGEIGDCDHSSYTHTMSGGNSRQAGTSNTPDSKSDSSLGISLSRRLSALGMVSDRHHSKSSPHGSSTPSTGNHILDSSRYSITVQPKHRKLAIGRTQVIVVDGRQCLVPRRGKEQNRFFQQEFEDRMWPSWFYTPPILLIGSVILGIVMIFLGALILMVNNSLHEVQLTYSSNDHVVDFELAEDMKGPVFMYYQLSGFWGNYRTFVESKDDYVFSSSFAKYNCDGSQVSSDLQTVRPGDIEFEELVETSVANNGGDTELRPCGMIALTFFMDEYRLTDASRDGADILLDQTDLAWHSDDIVLDDKMVSSASNVTIEDMTSWLSSEHLEHFKVWYRTSASSKVRQLWARIPEGLRAGKYIMNITKNDKIWDAQWNVGKAIVLTEVSAFGCKVNVLGELFIAWGLIMIVSSCFVYLGPPTEIRRWWQNLTEPVAPPLPASDKPARTTTRTEQSVNIPASELSPQDHVDEARESSSSKEQNIPVGIVRKNSRGSILITTTGPIDAM